MKKSLSSRTVNRDKEVCNVVQAPALTIAANAGYDGSLVVGKLLEQDDCNFGFDASKGESEIAFLNISKAQTSSDSECFCRVCFV